MTQPLVEHVARAWQAFDHAAGRSWCVTPAAPILFFGDLHAYQASSLRVLTVGLNPSLHEFPADDPFRRFPVAEGCIARQPSHYLDAMSAYFRTCPYRRWFSNFEQLLDGMEASYNAGRASTALHTDICSPVATNPTWSELDEDVRSVLAADGSVLWHMLLEELRPQVVALSVAKAHLKRIKFAPMTDWGIIHAFGRRASGELRPRPYEICARWYDVGGERSLFIFGEAGRTPWKLAANQKRTAGELSLKAYGEGRSALLRSEAFVQFRTVATGAR